MKSIKQKRFQYWGSTNGVPSIRWTTWFEFDGTEESVQLKGFKGRHLRNEYRAIPL